MIARRATEGCKTNTGSYYVFTLCMCVAYVLFVFNVQSTLDFHVGSGSGSAI